MKVILCCSCFRMDKKASEAYALLFPNDVLPQIIKGRDRVYKFASVHNNDHIKAIAKLSGKYAYYVNLGEDDKIKEEYDLVKGKRIA